MEDHMVSVKDLQVGDWYKDSTVEWIVQGEPIESTNAQLFSGNTCVVVPVSYTDGSRGSRLFSPTHELLIRR